MTRRLQALMRTVCIILILMLLPSTARLQERKEPAVPQQDQTAAEPATAESGSLTVPPSPETQTPADAPPQQIDAAAPAEEPIVTGQAPSTEPSTSYAIIKGDTLWDIANRFLKDPFLWPFIWKANPSIANPDLIFVGNKLAIPGLAPIEQAMKADGSPKTPVAEQQAVVEEPMQPRETRQREGIAAAGVIRPKSPQAAAAPEEETLAEKSGIIIPEERIFPIIDKYAMLSAGFVNEEETEDSIVGAPEKGKTVFGYDDIVYVSFQDGENIAIGDKYLIYAPLQKVKHPKTGRNFGKLTKGLGILQITAKNPKVKVLTARITLSFDAIEKGNLLTPYQEPVLIYPSPQKKAKDISGYILEVTDRRSINSQTDVVYLDKGASDGVEPGDVFLVYGEPENRKFPKEVIGELQVLLVKERTSTAVVRRGTEAMSRGNAVAFKN